MPPLRDHLDDLPSLVAALLEDLNRKHHAAVKGVADEVLEVFRQYSWPGNARELRNTLERAVVTRSGDVLLKKDLPPDFGSPRGPGVENGLYLRPGMTVADAERLLIFETLASAQNNKTQAAEMLGISLKTLHNKLKEYEDQPQS
jgi:DNA-binding NtrC family response regulator